MNEKQPSDTKNTAPNPGWLPRWEIVTLVIGDLIALFIFAGIGRASHDLDGSASPFLATLNTAIPFTLAWIVAGMVTGHYLGAALHPLKRVISKALLTGIIAGPAGVILRALWLARPISWSFMAVATGASTLLILVWRVGWSRLRRLWWPELP